MSLFPSFITLIAKILNVMQKIRSLQNLIEEIDELVKKEFKDSSKLKKKTDKAYIIFKMYVSCGLLTSTAALMNPILHHIWAFPMWLPFGLHKSSEIAFWIISVYQSVVSYTFETVNETLDMLPVFMLSYVSGMIDELAHSIGKIRKHKTLNPDGSINQNPKPDNRAKLLEYIEVHHQIVEINKKIQEIFSTIIMTQALVSAVVLCTTIVTMTNVELKTNFALFAELFVYMLVMTLQILLPCYYGNEVKLSSDKLSQELFHTDWYGESNEHKKVVKMFMECNKKPSTIRAFREFDIDLKIFTFTCNTAYTLYAIFRKHE